MKAFLFYVPNGERKCGPRERFLESEYIIQKVTGTVNLRINVVTDAQYVYCI